MALKNTYRDYFDIDPEYFPAVNEDVINKNPDMWKKFYPHEAFIKLVQDTVNVLERRQKASIWVEGSYGTGKSHAVLTLKKLLDADEAETREYFENFKLHDDLCKRLQAVKRDGKLLTVHRYGSASIRSDSDLVFAVQNSLENALTAKGITSAALPSYKKAFLGWLGKPANKDYFNALITGEYRDLFGGDDADAVIAKLDSLADDALETLMTNAFKVTKENQITALALDAKSLADWIREVIKATGLKIVFIWDEFTEYFKQNKHALTGFQELCELSATVPFYFVIVTHLSQSLFREDDADFSKLNDRFVAPHCVITLPATIAFRLLAAAMEKTDDQTMLEDWRVKIIGTLRANTEQSRHLVEKAANITEQEMIDILPIHPYAALVLKNIAEEFDSNQRSMFDFIKNDHGDEIKGFQWFIDNCGPLKANPLLTADMLWDFFYEKGKTLLTAEYRNILDYYGRVASAKMSDDQKRVLKTILMLMAISRKVGGSVNLFVPNAKNLELAFEGSDLKNGDAVKCARQMIEGDDKVLRVKKVGGAEQYDIRGDGEIIDLRPLLADIDNEKTAKFINEELIDHTTISSVVTESLSAALKLRYELSNTGCDGADTQARKLCDEQDRRSNKIVGTVGFARNDEEYDDLVRKFKAAASKPNCKIVMICPTVTFGSDLYTNFRESRAYSKYYAGKDQGQAIQYGLEARDFLKKWKDNISNGAFVVYYAEKPEGERANTMKDLEQLLLKIDRALFPQCLEGMFTVIDNMYSVNNLKQGAGCGAEEKTTGTFLSKNAQTKLEKNLDGAWGVTEYWDDKPHLPISKIKIRVEEVIEKAMENGRVSIGEIYAVLREAPFGFIPCNLTAFVLGFLLKEYVGDEYSWSNGMTTEPFSVDKMKEMIDGVLRHELTPKNSYKENYIVSMSAEQKAFNALASVAFDVPESRCSSVPDARERIRGKMKSLSFQIWVLKSLLDQTKLQTDAGVLSKMLDGFSGIANSNNMGAKSENDLAMELGKLAQANPDAAADLRTLLTKENCTRGMDAYLHAFEGGKLIDLAKEVGDGGQYINKLRAKFDADAANWVWNQDTADDKIREVIQEYEIIAESNKMIAKTADFDQTIGGWCQKAGTLRIAYAAVKDSLKNIGMEDLKPFLDLLCSMKKSGRLPEAQRERFLTELRAHGDQFRNFEADQASLFKAAFVYYLDGLTDEECSECFLDLPGGAFTVDKREFIVRTERAIDAYKNGLRNVQLKKFWRDRTGTESPLEWSRQNQMPILCLISSAELSTAKAAFDAVNSSSQSKESVDKAQEYFGKTDVFEKMNDPAALDAAFRERILKDNQVLLTDIDEVKKLLGKKIIEDPYNWLGRPDLDEYLNQLAESKYMHGGSDLALEKINNMDEDKVKSYLKDLIRNNMKVGIEIIKGE